MSRHTETNPHFLPRQQDPIIDFTSQSPPPRSRQPPRRHGRTSTEPSRGRTSPPPYYGRPSVEPPPYGRTSSPPPYHGRASVEPPPHGRVSPPPYHGRTSAEPPPHGRVSPPPHHGRTSVEPPHHGRTSPHQPPTHNSPTHVKPVPPVQVEIPNQSHYEPGPHSASDPDSRAHSGRGHGGGRGHGQHRHHHHPAFIHPPTSQRTKPVAWLLAAFCALFWILVIVAGLVILIVYLVFRPRSPRFDISSTTFNAAYLDMGYLLNADMTVLANFTNSNSKVNVEFSYVLLDLYFDKKFIATRYFEPFSVKKGQSKFADVHMVASQVNLSAEQSQQLRKQIEEGRVHFEIKGLFRTRSKLGGIFHYSYWLYAHCQLVVTGPPTGVLIGKKCLTKRNI